MTNNQGHFRGLLAGMVLVISTLAGCSDEQASSDASGGAADVGGQENSSTSAGAGAALGAQVGGDAGSPTSAGAALRYRKNKGDWQIQEFPPVDTPDFGQLATAKNGIAALVLWDDLLAGKAARPRIFMFR